MTKMLVSVLDLKAKFFFPPQCVRNRGEGIRMLTVAVNDPQSNIHQFPADFVLYEVGSFDEDSGEVLKCTPVIIVSAIELKEKPMSEAPLLDRIK